MTWITVLHTRYIYRLWMIWITVLHTFSQEWITSAYICCVVFCKFCKTDEKQSFIIEWKIVESVSACEFLTIEQFVRNLDFITRACNIIEV